MAQLEATELETVKDNLQAVKDDFIKRMVWKFKFWAPMYDPAFWLQTIGRSTEVRDEFIATIKTRDGDILDVCCGTGTVTNKLAKQRSDASITGFDLSEQMLKVSKKKQSALGLNNLKWVQGDAMDMPFEANTFDTVINSFGLHEVPASEGHIKEECLIRSIISEMHRVLKPGGQLVLQDYRTPDVQPWKAIFNLMLYIFEPHDTFIYCSAGLDGCVKCSVGSEVKDIELKPCWRGSAILSATKI